MKWNYRVVRRSYDDDEDEYGIHEVYYDDEPGEIVQWSQSRIGPHGGTLEELAADLKLVAEALDRPVLNYADLPGHPERKPDS